MALINIIYNEWWVQLWAVLMWKAEPPAPQTVGMWTFDSKIPCLKPVFLPMERYKNTLPQGLCDSDEQLCDLLIPAQIGSNPELKLGKIDFSVPPIVHNHSWRFLLRGDGGRWSEHQNLLFLEPWQCREAHLGVLDWAGVVGNSLPLVVTSKRCFS